MFLNDSNSSSVDMLDLEQEAWHNVTSLLLPDSGGERAWPRAGVGEGESWPRQELPKQDPLYVVVPMTCVYALILVSGVVGNVSTCVVIARNKHMHTATNYYLFSLAISDLLLLVSGLPPEMYYIWSRYPYVFGEFFCVMTSFLAETSANATVLTITAFTVERYVAICHPFLSYTVSKLSRAVKFIMAIWVLALCLAVPQAIQFGIVMGTTINGTEVPESAQCTLKWELIKHAFHISTCLFFVVPMTLITALYVLIGLKLRRSRLIKRPSAVGATDHRQPGKSQNHVIRMLVAVVVAFFICWAPFHCQRLLAVYASTAEQHSSTFIAIYNALTYVSGILYFLSTTINPLLYHTMSNKFRQAFKSTLAQLCSPTRKGSHQSRTYSMLSRAGGPQTNMGAARTSVSGSTKELPLTLQSFARQRPSVPVLHDPRSSAVVQPTQFSPIHVISKKLKLLPLRSGTHMSIDSANTISNSSLQDVDDSEFTGYELVHYMGELNRR